MPPIQPTTVPSSSTATRLMRSSSNDSRTSASADSMSGQASGQCSRNPSTSRAATCLMACSSSGRRSSIRILLLRPYRGLLAVGTLGLYRRRAGGHYLAGLLGELQLEDTAQDSHRGGVSRVHAQVCEPDRAQVLAPRKGSI